MAYWIETEVGELVNLDRMNFIFIREDAVREYVNGDVEKGWGVMCSSEEIIHAICLHKTSEEAQAHIYKILLDMEKRNGNN